MATNARCKVESFLSKFCQLTSIGIDANVNFSSIHGNAFVNFTAKLGKCVLASTAAPYFSRDDKPSKIRRRRRRRKDARAQDIQSNAQITAGTMCLYIYISGFFLLMNNNKEYFLTKVFLVSSKETL